MARKLRKFAPGPWTKDGQGGVYDAHGFDVAHVSHTGIYHNWSAMGIDHWSCLPGTSFRDRSEAEQDATARLIAAAPDLFEAALPLAKIGELIPDNGYSFDTKELTLTYGQLRALYQAVQKAMEG